MGGKLKSIVSRCAHSRRRARRTRREWREDLSEDPRQARCLEAEIRTFSDGQPGQMLELKKLDVGCRGHEEAGHRRFRIESDDKKSAQAMFSINIWPQISSLPFSVGYFVVLIVLTGSVSIPVESQPVVSVVISIYCRDVQFWRSGSVAWGKERTI